MKKVIKTEIMFTWIFVSFLIGLPKMMLLRNDLWVLKILKSIRIPFLALTNADVRLRALGSPTQLNNFQFDRVQSVKRQLSPEFRRRTAECLHSVRWLSSLSGSRRASRSRKDHCSGWPGSTCSSRPWSRRTGHRFPTSPELVDDPREFVLQRFTFC